MTSLPVCKPRPLRVARTEATVVAVRRPGRAKRKARAALLSALITAGGLSAGPLPAAGATSVTAAANSSSTAACTAPQQKPTVEGDPDVRSVPSIKSVQVSPRSGGLLVSYYFRAPLALAPEGVYISWSVYLYRNRADAGDPEKAVDLQVEDRGKGWEPEGWSIVVSTYAADSVVEGNVRTNEAHEQLSVYFPAGFVDLSPPFFWFASQEEYRAYLPEHNNGQGQDWDVNGSVFNDCPAGVRQGPNSPPYAAMLLAGPL